jgi:hypothetical protein
VSRSDGPIKQLAKRRAITFGKFAIGRTPMLVPSFSSKGFPEVRNILKYSEGVIEGPMLVSAYDLNHKLIDGPFDFSPLIFLDSGGYEAQKEAELSDFGQFEHQPRGWSETQYSEEIKNWHSLSATVFITYDHPAERLSVAEQIDRANRLLPRSDSIVRELLLKPETQDQRFLKVGSVVDNIHRLAEFDVIGFTEKEIGASILDRMINIARIRYAMDSAGLDRPIHIFGSLDTVTTPLYFVVGADIFDGLTWLRFAYRDGFTLYKQNFGALQFELNTKTHLLDGRCWNTNYYYLKEMELEMKRFLNSHDFGEFKFHSEFFKRAFTNVLEEIGA